eukprot:gene8030-8680_t
MSYKLYYQALRARAEPIRMIFLYGGIPFEDEIIPLNDWSNFKNDKKVAPFAQLPALRLPNGSVIAETGAIIRLVAKLANIYPTDPFEAAKADMLFESAVDLNAVNVLLNWWELGSGDYKTNYETFFGILPHHLSTLDVELGSKPFFGGERPHHGDFALFNILSNTITIKPDALEGYPKLVAFIERVAKIPVIEQYLKNRPRATECGLPYAFIQVNKAEYPASN